LERSAAPRERRPHAFEDDGFRHGQLLSNLDRGLGEPENGI
jgi:hypothetical protein